MAKTYFTGKPCKRGHVALRYVSSAQCSICHQDSMRLRRATPEGKAKHLASVKRWQKANPEKVKNYKEKYFEQNRQKIYEKTAAYRKAHPDRRRAILRAYSQKNKDKLCAAVRKRQILKQRAMPSWVDVDAINLIYKQSEYVSLLAQVPHEVDHIVPLRNSKVCGLHVPWNLQIITTTENRRKGNLFQGSR